MPAWTEFNWGSRGPAYRVGEVIVAHFNWDLTMQANLYGHDESNGMLLNVFHVASLDIIDESVCLAVAEVIKAWCQIRYSQAWAEEISSDRVVVTDVSVIDGDQAELACNASGAYLGVAVPSSNTLAVKKSTGKSGRANRGDWYAWPPTVSQLEPLDSNLFLESYRDNVVAALEELRTDLLAAGFALVVASKATGLTRPVHHFVATDRAVDSQRRRLKGRGR